MKCLKQFLRAIKLNLFDFFFRSAMIIRRKEARYGIYDEYACDTMNEFLPTEQFNVND